MNKPEHNELKKAIGGKIYFNFFDDKDDLRKGGRGRHDDLFSGVLQDFNPQKGLMIKNRHDTITTIPLSKIYVVYRREKTGKHWWNSERYELIYANINNHKKREAQLKNLAYWIPSLEIIGIGALVALMLVGDFGVINFLLALRGFLPTAVFINAVPIIGLSAILGFLAIYLVGMRTIGLIFRNYANTHDYHDYNIMKWALKLGDNQ